MNADLLLIVCLGTHIGEIWNKIKIFPVKKMYKFENFISKMAAMH